MQKLITIPVKKMSEAAMQLSEGNLQIDHLSYQSQDEIGQLSNSMINMSVILRRLISELNELSIGFIDGDIESEIDSTKFSGTYRKVAHSINALCQSQTNDTFKLLDCMKAFGNGDFNADIEKVPGKKVVINNVLDTVCDNLQSIDIDISTLVNDAINGRLESAPMQATTMAIGLNGLNRLMEAIAAPIHEAAGVL